MLNVSPLLRTHDINRAAETAAAALADKVASRNISVELRIDPVLPPVGIEIARIVPILMLIAENASASVEPGPGTVILQTWCTDKLIGVDVVGQNGVVPKEIRDSWTLPGFSTRVADWDTGFGLHAALEAATAIAAKIELLELLDAVTFRFAIPLHAKMPFPSLEAEVGIPDSGNKSGETAEVKGDLPSYTLLGLMGGTTDVFEHGIIQA
jgi:nitrogen-specific signal transduction histidine kinase